MVDEEIELVLRIDLAGEAGWLLAAVLELLLVLAAVAAALLEGAGEVKFSQKNGFNSNSCASWLVAVVFPTSIAVSQHT